MALKRKKWEQVKIDRRPHGKNFAILWDFMYGLQLDEIYRKYDISKFTLYRLKRKYETWLVHTSERIDAELAKQMAIRMLLGHDEYNEAGKDFEDMVYRSKKEQDN